MAKFGNIEISYSGDKTESTATFKKNLLNAIEWITAKRVSQTLTTAIEKERIHISEKRKRSKKDII